MSANRNQNTIRRACQVNGRGYWSGQPITLTFLPAPPDSGIRFVRTDLDGTPSVEASSDFRIDMPLRTRLAKGSAVVDMVEHVLATLFALKIDNVEIHCTNCEMPGLDGSSHAYALAFAAAELRQQPAAKPVFHVTGPIRLGSDDQWIAAYPISEPHLEIEYRLDYGPAGPIGRSVYACRVNAETFERELAPARTFITLHEAQQLQNGRGLARHVTPRDLLVFDESGPIDNSLRFPDECARHKALDLLGDLALAGVDLVGRVVACRSGHQLNGKLAHALRGHAAAADGRIALRRAA